MTDTFKRITITQNKDLCDEGYDSDSNIGTFFDAVTDEEDIEYYTEKVINTLVGFQGSMDPSAVETI